MFSGAVNIVKKIISDKALMNTIIICAAAVATGGVAGAYIGFAAGGGFAGLAAGAVAGAVVGGITGAVVGGTLSVVEGGSFIDGAVSGGVTGMIAGGLAGAYVGFINPYFSNAPTTAGLFDFLDGCIGGAATAGVGFAAVAAGYALIPMTGGASIALGWWAAGAVGGGALVGAGTKGALSCL
jgi:hypothetical protein